MQVVLLPKPKLVELEYSSINIGKQLYLFSQEIVYALYAREHLFALDKKFWDIFNTTCKLFPG